MTIRVVFSTGQEVRVESGTKLSRVIQVMGMKMDFP